ncbi:KpsF/GutQ family sugar-phosphate isomerase [Crenobacter intestini]|uniref:KpsF/GutQ family sugar-phosphate isomerase n=1 Tax=Crenobacter intestini TaxID=2563443 RepID=A0A4T0UZE1_9NEIS|nr:KpsF/GutQ family sugar-phosphate isomerase [Crenobacter intestini]TIC84590.1 KpsF/GutQ family sugar-phosphate isomerase [Crenobacter intestini]
MEQQIAQHRLDLAREVLKVEADAIGRLASRLGTAFVAVIDTLLACRGRVVVTGIGKSGHIARKIAATMASTGTPAFFVHPAEAAHGDLGMIAESDVLIALSNSGESDEVIALLPALKRKGIRLIAMTGRVDSTLAREADIHLDASVEREACPLGLAPTASTTTALALGDALAVTLLDARGFGKEDFALSHPGGSLGRRLLVHVRDVMHTGEALPQVTCGTPLKGALLEISQKGLGMTAVVGADGRLAGLYTDGDLRRTLDTTDSLAGLVIDDVMTRAPRTITADKLAAEAVQLMQRHKINGLIVVDTDGRAQGALNMHDLMRAGVV